MDKRTKMLLALGGIAVVGYILYTQTDLAAEATKKTSWGSTPGGSGGAAYGAGEGDSGGIIYNISFPPPPNIDFGGLFSDDQPPASFWDPIGMSKKSSANGTLSPSYIQSHLSARYPGASSSEVAKKVQSSGVYSPSFISETKK